jgi:hypothetical protein
MQSLRSCDCLGACFMLHVLYLCSMLSCMLPDDIGGSTFNEQDDSRRASEDILARRKRSSGGYFNL